MSGGWRSDGRGRQSLVIDPHELTNVIAAHRMHKLVQSEEADARAHATGGRQRSAAIAYTAQLLRQQHRRSGRDLWTVP
jgi:hypothetical protein